MSNHVQPDTIRFLGKVTLFGKRPHNGNSLHRQELMNPPSKYSKVRNNETWRNFHFNVNRVIGYNHVNIHCLGAHYLEFNCNLYYGNVGFARNFSEKAFHKKV